MYTIKPIWILFLLFNFIIKSAELKQVKQKYNYKVTLEDIKKFKSKSLGYFPDTIISKIISYHKKTITHLSFFKHVLSFTSIERLTSDQNKNYLIVKCKDQVPKAFNLDDSKLINHNDPRYKEAEENLESIEPIEDNCKDNIKFGILFYPAEKYGEGADIISIRIPKEYLLKLVQNMPINQIELMLDLSRASMLTTCKALSKNLSKEKTLKLNYQQSSVFFSLPKFFLKIYANIDSCKLEFEV